MSQAIGLAMSIQYTRVTDGPQNLRTDNLYKKRAQHSSATTTRTYSYSIAQQSVTR